MTQGGLGSSLVAGIAVLVASLITPSSAADSIPALKKNQGYLLVHTDVASTTVNWRLNSALIIDTVPIGEKFQLFALRKGSYQWKEISVPYFNLPRVLDLKDDDRWSFDIRPGVINYVGTLIVGEFRSKNNVDVRFINRSAEILPQVSKQFPKQVQQYSLVYSGKSDDQFLELLGNATKNP